MAITYSARYSSSKASTSSSVTLPISSTSSPTGQVFTCQPSLICASTLSPSVTATSRMLSPKRTTRRSRLTFRPTAARIHSPNSLSGSSSCQYPTTTLRGRRIRAPMNPCSRSPCAAWLRFMKSMSICLSGIDRLYWVAKWHHGFCRSARPLIHILLGEKVCAHVTMPQQRSS